MIGLPGKYNNIPKLLRSLEISNEKKILSAGNKRALSLFHQMAERVPAYKRFLKKEKINRKNVKNIHDFLQIPLLDKDNYLRYYPFEELFWDGKFKKGQWEIASTSGSTGIPFYFPRCDLQNFQYAASAELYLLNNFNINKKTTLYINCFALGVWIGGLYTYEAIRIISRRGRYPLSIINPGLNKPEILKAVKNLGCLYDQVILGGYPPFIKDVLDEGEDFGIRWRNYNIGIIFSAEGFSENFRNYIAKKAGIKNPIIRTLNHYGTVDQGTIAHETPISILIRRLSVLNNNFSQKIFRSNFNHLPTLAQYDPELFYFEEIDKGLVCSSYSGIPLVRYDLKDYGGIISYADIMHHCVSSGIDIDKEISRYEIKHINWKLPFVYVYERKDMCVVLSGANIYVENIKHALEQSKFYSIITGRFTMFINYDHLQNQFLEINIELKNNIKEIEKSFIQSIRKSILDTLMRENSEFRIIYEQKRKRVVPVLRFWPYEHKKYFGLGGKQKWVIKK